MTATSSHAWRFFRAGGSDQVALERGADLLNLQHLDPKLWVALACPVNGLEIDSATLRLMDADGDGRLRVPELLAAVKWATGVLKDPESLMKGGDLPLAMINDASDEGKQIAASAREILAGLGKGGHATISVADTMATAKLFAETRFNGDGVIPIEDIEDATLKELAERIVAHAGGSMDRSGKAGIAQPAIDKFYEDCAAYDAWYKEGEANAAALLPLGDKTEAAVAAVRAVRGKVDDFFARCRLAAFDARSLNAVNRREEEYLELAAGDFSITAQEVAGFPLARVEAWRALPLVAQRTQSHDVVEGLNPAWAGAIETFRTTAVAPILGGDPMQLTEAQWDSIKAKLAAHEDWASRKAGATLESLGVAGVRALLAGRERDSLTALVSQDAAREPEMSAIAAVERLARYHRDLFQLLNNFVSFRDFYSRERPAVFQVGTLFLDGRSCDLCVRVDDAGKHAALAGLAKSYLAYCDVTRPGEKMTIAAAFTDGDSDNLMVGRNGVFYDRQGRDWDATITKVIENPISIRQAFWSPYKKAVRLVEEMVAKRAAAGEAAADAKLGGAAEATANIDKKAAEPKKIDVGTVAALGVAFGAIGTLLATIVGGLLGILTLPFWKVVLALAGILLLVSTPSMLIAWLKLRQRNLGPILDANGWAVNGRVKMNVPFGGSLTKVATLPANAGSSLQVKYPEPPTALPKLAFTVVVIAFLASLLNHFGVIHSLSGGRLGSEYKPESAVKVEKPADAGVP
jgi:hypothetical protein